MFALLVAVVGTVALFLLVGGVRSAARAHRENPRWLRFQALNAGLWTAAILSLSQCFAVFRRVSGERPNPYPLLNLFGGALAVALLLACCVALGFFMYREDSRTGKLKRRLGLYDRFLSARDRSGAGADPATPDNGGAVEPGPASELVGSSAGQGASKGSSHGRSRRKSHG
ncbi:MAG TPA: hypothetical protein VFJ58_22750 [Armatimonadota bacterium]|nr:hypothetical protein [Armatimonadota bacterium]